MTAKPDLLPLRDWMECLGEINAEDIRDYARANVAHATAAKDAEIEALRAEVRRQKGQIKRMAREEYDMIQRHKGTEARAELLAEALREARDYVTTALREEREKFAGHEDCSDIPGIEADLHKIDALLRDQEEGE